MAFAFALLLQSRPHEYAWSDLIMVASLEAQWFDRRSYVLEVVADLGVDENVGETRMGGQPSEQKRQLA